MKPYEPLEPEIIQAYQTRYSLLSARASHKVSIKNMEDNAKAELGEVWESAKNNDVRKALLLQQLADNEDYWRRVNGLDDTEEDIELIENQISMLRLLVQLRATTSR